MVLVLYSYLIGTNTYSMCILDAADHLNVEFIVLQCIGDDEGAVHCRRHSWRQSSVFDIVWKFFALV